MYIRSLPVKICTRLLRRLTCTLATWNNLSRKTSENRCGLYLHQLFGEIHFLQTRGVMYFPFSMYCQGVVNLTSAVPSSSRTAASKTAELKVLKHNLKETPNISALGVNTLKKSLKAGFKTNIWNSTFQRASQHSTLSRLHILSIYFPSPLQHLFDKRTFIKLLEI